MATLTIESVYKQYVQGTMITRVLRGASYTFESQKTYAITGVSGTGKSTLMHLLSGIDRPTTGRVLINETALDDLTSSAQERFLNKTVGLVFQDPYLIKELTVVENVMLKGLIASEPYGALRKMALDLLKRIGLADKADHQPLSLSGGQQQRVAVLRAIANRPLFLVADEPTGSLDKDNVQAVLDLMLAGVKEWGMGLIVSSHDPAVAERMDVKLTLADGVLR